MCYTVKNIVGMAKLAVKSPLMFVSDIEGKNEG